ncbi:hypothetical protein BJ875DRAFT_476421 [Amylocarpus encephaloides]|uniref:Uncharacterized protein n=1 Tax=Amylocarpus encephaloides TaxID=45428 RepID=A0A9P8C0G9_9HELO|nr:hypothetical protein BJ875DRAFT_476421 [Amylocarpus encephaloides]
MSDSIVRNLYLTGEDGSLSPVKRDDYAHLPKPAKDHLLCQVKATLNQLLQSSSEAEIFKFISNKFDTSQRNHGDYVKLFSIRFTDDGEHHLLRKFLENLPIGAFLKVILKITVEELISIQNRLDDFARHVRPTPLKKVKKHLHKFTALQGYGSFYVEYTAALKSTRSKKSKRRSRAARREENEEPVTKAINFALGTYILAVLPFEGPYSNDRQISLHPAKRPRVEAGEPSRSIFPDSVLCNLLREYVRSGTPAPGTELDQQHEAMETENDQSSSDGEQAGESFEKIADETTTANRGFNKPSNTDSSPLVASANVSHSTALSSQHVGMIPGENQIADQAFSSRSSSELSILDSQYFDSESEDPDATAS